jgi:hypothetical protein
MGSLLRVVTASPQLSTVWRARVVIISAMVAVCATFVRVREALLLKVLHAPLMVKEVVQTAKLVTTRKGDTALKTAATAAWVLQLQGRLVPNMVHWLVLAVNQVHPYLRVCAN